MSPPHSLTHSHAREAVRGVVRVPPDDLEDVVAQRPRPSALLLHAPGRADDQVQEHGDDVLCVPRGIGSWRWAVG